MFTKRIHVQFTFINEKVLKSNEKDWMNLPGKRLCNGMAVWKFFVGRVEIPKLSKTLQEKVNENRKRRTYRFMLNT